MISSRFIARRLTTVLLVAIVAAWLPTVCRTWQPDRYLAGYEETQIDQPDDYSGHVIATVVRRMAPCGGDIGVLYVHGFNDYFFQAEMGNRFVDSCYNFYAVDLRKYGRSLLPDQKPYQARNIDEYYADIDSTLAIMRNDGIRRVVLMGHSTGGLVVASYMNNAPDTAAVKALILNSPFLEWNMGGFMRKIAIPTVTWIGRWAPNLSISQGDGTAYAESLLKQYHGEWDYDTNLKTVHPRKVTAGWIRAITLAQRRLHKHSDIKCPILLMHSDNSVSDGKWSPEHQHGDGVLNVDDISRWGMSLGPCVTEDAITGGMHDLVLSAPDVREKVYHDIFALLRHLGLTPRN